MKENLFTCKVVLMNLKKPYVFIIIFSLFFFIASEIVSFYIDYQNSKATIYKNDKSAINNLLTAQEENLRMLANIFSNDVSVLEAYEKNDPNIIREHLGPVWKKMKKEKLIYEIHFFKPPATSFVNFSNFHSINKDVSSARKDILWVTTSFKPSTHNLMCKTYAGVRATYPIINDERKLLGGLSLGRKIDWLPSAFKKNTQRDAFLLYTKTSVATLDPKYYKIFMQDKQIVGDYIFANTTHQAITPEIVKKIDFTQNIQYVFINGSLYLLDKHPILDFSNQTLGYLFVLNNVKPYFLTYLKDLILNFMLIVLTALIIFFITRKALSEIHAKLQKNLDDLNLAQATAKMGSYIYNIQTGSIEWSENHYRLFKLNKEEFTPTLERFMSFVHPEDRKYVKECLQEAIESQKELSIEYRVVLQDETILYIRSTSLYVKNRDGEFLSGTIQDISEYKKLAIENEQKTKMLQEQLYTDELTALPNRRALVEDMRKYPDAHIAILNIKSFKNINDVFGFEVGNFTLQALAKKLFEKSDEKEIHLYRIGSDEFAVLNTKLQKQEFVRFISLLIDEIEHRTFYFEPKEIELNIALYAGICLSKQNRLACADVALTQANKLHKDYVIYSSSKNLIEEQKQRLKITNIIKNALLNDKIILYAQAIVNQNKELHKYETLVRLEYEGEVLTPYQFLEVSKKTKYYPSITRRVVKQAMELFKDRTESFSINLIAEDILNESTLDFIRSEVEAFEQKERIVFEIVESEDIYKIPDVATFIKEMQSLGVKIAIDDFGTGYSNFSYLMELQPNYIKIDGSLIKELNSNAKAKNIVTTIVTFAKELHCKTVAEFVHSEEIFTICKKLGIDEFQGYYFEEPHPL
jgi:diguanylate cyclase (GGDEF)-like protein